jgi:hypothetical protein
MSGNLGQQTNQAPLARQVGGGGTTINVNSGGGPAPAKPQTPTMQQGVQQNPSSMINPEFYMQVLDSYMKALMDSVESGRPLIGGIY